jgi:hypothetical protein
MVSVPAFLLKRLYVKGSLTATADGFEFRIENKLGSGHSVEMMPIMLDGESFPTSQAYFRRDESPSPAPRSSGEAGGERAILFSEVSAQNPFTLEMNRGLTIGVHGATLTPGPHQIEMGFVVQGIGQLKLKVSDVV